MIIDDENDVVDADGDDDDDDDVDKGDWLVRMIDNIDDCCCWRWW